MSVLSNYEKRLKEEPSFFVREVIGAEPTDYQEEFMDADSTRRAFVTGRQVGKSRTCSWLAIHHAITHPGHDVLITADALRQSGELFNTIKSEMALAVQNTDNDIIQSDDDWGVDRQTQTIIEFDNGSRVICLPTGRDGSKIRGYTADMIIVDEAAFIEDSIFQEVLMPMLLVTDGHLILASTPFGNDGFFYDKATHPDWYSTWDEEEKKGISSWDNPHVSDKDLEEYVESMDEVQYEQEILGRFVESADSFFPKEIVKACMGDTKRGYRENESNDPGCKVYLGADLARHGTDETVLVMIDEYGNVYDYESYSKHGLTSAINRVKSLDNAHGFDKILVDETGLGGGPVEILQNDIGRKVEGFKFSLNSKQNLYQTLKSELEQENIRIPNEVRLRNQLTNMGYSLTKNGKMSIHAKGGGKDDFVDALALAVWASGVSPANQNHRGSKKPRTLGRMQGARNRRRPRRQSRRRR